MNVACSDQKRLITTNTAVMCCRDMEVDRQPEEACTFDEDSLELGDVKDMRLEAEAVVNDVLFAVSEMHVSQNLGSASDVAYINVETREGNRYCLELTEAGLRVGAHSQETFGCNLMKSHRLFSHLSITRWWATFSIKWMKI